MMDKRYTRLKLKMLLLVVAGTLGALAAALFLWEMVVDGLLQDPFARSVLWVCQNLFGCDEAGALEIYQHVFRNHKGTWLLVGTILLMLGAFYVAMGRFIRWLDQIGAAVRQVVNETGETVRLPKELRPVEEDLRSIQRTLGGRETEAREAEQRRQDLVAFLAHDLKTPLTSVLGYLNLLHDEPGLTAEQRAKYTGIALDKARRLEELLGEPFFLTEKNANYRKAFDRYLASKNILLTPFLEISNTEFILKMIEENKGLSFLPRFAVEESAESGHIRVLDVIDFHASMYRQIFYHKDKWKTREMDEFIRLASLE